MSDDIIAKANAILAAQMGKPKEGRESTLKEKVRQLAPNIKLALSNGYSIGEIATLLQKNVGLEIKARTLKEYYYKTREQETSKKRAKSTKSKQGTMKVEQKEAVSPAPATLQVAGRSQQLQSQPAPSPAQGGSHEQVHLAWDEVGLGREQPQTQQRKQIEINGQIFEVDSDIFNNIYGK